MLRSYYRSDVAVSIRWGRHFWSYLWSMVVVELDGDCSLSILVESPMRG